MHASHWEKRDFLIKVSNRQGVIIPKRHELFTAILYQRLSI